MAAVAKSSPDEVPPISVGGDVLERLCHYASLAVAPSTRRTYTTGERRYLAFCAVCRWDPLPATDLTLSCFAAHMAGRVKPGTVRVYLAAVRNLHLDLGLPDPTANSTLLHRVTKGIHRAHGPAAGRPRLPITVDILHKLARALLGSDTNIVDRLMLHAAILLAFHGCLRGAEFTAPTPFDHRRHASRGDISINLDGMQFHLKSSKADQLCKGTTIHIGRCKPPLCAVTAPSAYLNVTSGGP